VFIDEALRSGAARVVVGTRAISDPAWLDTVLARYGNEQILVAIDTIQGIVSVEGWETQTMMTAPTIGLRLRKQGVERIIYQDLGAFASGMAGVNFGPVEELVQKSGLRLIVSGGIRKLEHLEELRRRLGEHLDGAIVDRGIAEGTFDLALAFARIAPAG
jgi:phosphoribosylformimino-5-aminoimidazole carboxamide ribotide isomerase